MSGLYGWSENEKAWLGFGIAMAGFLIYFLPTIVAVMRRTNWPPIFALNLLAGYTVIGWFVAMWWACFVKTALELAQAEHDFIRRAVADGTEDAMYPHMRRQPSSLPGNMAARRPPVTNQPIRREPPPLRRG